MSDKRRLLFVDDEANILQGLKRMLRSERNEWDMVFANSGEEAMQIIDSDPVEIVISDMRMPGMSGVDLLKAVQEKHPEVIRFVLSGHADQDMIIQSVGVTHQYLAKPCDPELLKKSVTRAFALRELLHGDKVQEIVKDQSSLPSLPDLYQKLSAKLNSKNSTAKDISVIISQDISMTARVLQMVNSAFFGLQREVESVEQAVSFLGVETISGIVLTSGVFESFKSEQVEKFDIPALNEHSTAVGAFASRISKDVLKSKKLADEATLAGMMHDVGILVLISENSEAWEEAYNRHQAENRPLYELEREVLGVTHGEIGAYLLGLWGFVDNVVEAVAFHHEPSLSTTDTFSTLAAVHISDVIEFAHRSVEPKTWEAKLDEQFIDKIGVSGEIDKYVEQFIAERDGQAGGE
ncbi:hypothetical protein BVX97_03180 [bacterium E08(2017)]|nr:hypothetical protein BVX97_03180 [bacterium E08(2017)]